MNQRKRYNIARGLRDFADSYQSDALNDINAVELLVSTSDTLMQFYGNENQDLYQLSAEDRNKILDMMQRIAEVIRNAAVQIETHEKAAMPQDQRDLLVNNIDKVKKDCDLREKELTDLQTSLDGKESDLARLKEEVNEKSRKYVKLDSEYRELQRQNAQYDRDIAKLESDIEEIEQEIRTKKDRKKELVQQKAGLEQQRTDLSNEVRNHETAIAELKSKIKGQPQKARVLAVLQTKMERKLKRIRHAMKDFTPEVQEKLQNDINREQEALTSESEKTEELRGLLERVGNVRAEVNAENETLTQDVLERMQVAFDKLGTELKIHNKRLDEMKCIADEYSKQVKACEELRKKYKACWETDDRFVQQVRQKLINGDELDENLRKELNPQTDKCICELMTTIEKALGEMAKHITKFNEALSQDYEIIAKRA